MLFGITALLGILPAAAVPAATSVVERTFAAISSPVQILMSVTVPFFGVLLASDLARSRFGARLAMTSTLLGATVLAVGFAVFGVVITAVAVR